MSGKVLVGGTAYAVKAGKVLVGGTAYAVKKGRTLIGGTGYDINLESKFQFDISLWGGCNVLFYVGLSDGTKYTIQGSSSAQKKSYELKAGETVTLTLVSHPTTTVLLYANGAIAYWDDAPYTFTVTKDCSLTATWERDPNFAVDAEVFRLIY